MPMYGYKDSMRDEAARLYAANKDKKRSYGRVNAAPTAEPMQPTGGSDMRYVPQEEAPGYEGWEDPWANSSEEQNAVRDYLHQKATGAVSEAMQQSRRMSQEYSSGLRSAQASIQGEFNPYLARQLERQASQGLPARDARLTAQQEQQVAAGQELDFESQMSAANDRYQEALQRWEKTVNEYKFYYNAFLDRALADTKNRELAQERALQQLAQMGLMEQMRAERAALQARAEERRQTYQAWTNVIQGIGAGLNAASAGA